MARKKSVAPPATAAAWGSDFTMRVARTGSHVSSIADNHLAAAEMSSAIDDIVAAYGVSGKAPFIEGLIAQLEERGTPHRAEQLRTFLQTGNFSAQAAAA